MTPISASFGGASRRGFGMTSGAKALPLAPTYVTQLQPGSTGTIMNSLYIPEAGNTILILFLNGVPSNSMNINPSTPPGFIQIAWGVANETAYVVQYKLRKNGIDSLLSTAATMYSGPAEVIFSPFLPYFSAGVVPCPYYNNGFSRYQILRSNNIVYDSNGIQGGGGQSIYYDYGPLVPGNTYTYQIKRSVGDATQQLWYSTPFNYNVDVPNAPYNLSASASGFAFDAYWDWNAANPSSFTVDATQHVSFDGGQTYPYVFSMSSVTVAGSSRSSTNMYMEASQGGLCEAYVAFSVTANGVTADVGYSAFAFGVYC